jgi:hypothetical protein
MFALASAASSVIAPSASSRRAAAGRVVATAGRVPRRKPGASSYPLTRPSLSRGAAAGPAQSSRTSKFAGNAAAALRATPTCVRLGSCRPGRVAQVDNSGLHSSSFQLNVSAVCGRGGVFGGCFWGYLGGIRGCLGCVFVSETVSREVHECKHLADSIKTRVESAYGVSA